MRASRHGPRRLLLGDLDEASVFGVGSTSDRPARGRHGEFLVGGPVPALAQGSVVVGDVAAGAGASVALPSVYVAHLEGCLRRLVDAATAGDVRSLPWPFQGLAAAVDDAVRRDGDGWVDLGRLADDEPLWTGWADALVARRGFRVAAPWVPGYGPLGYGRWLPADLVEHATMRDDGLRVLDLDADRLAAALTWHGVQAARADERLAAVLVGWTANLPGTATSSCTSSNVEVIVLQDRALPVADLA